MLTGLLSGHEYFETKEFERTKEKDISMPGRLKSGEVVGTTSYDSYQIWL